MTNDKSRTAETPADDPRGSDEFEEALREAVQEWRKEHNRLRKDPAKTWSGDESKGYKECANDIEAILEEYADDTEESHPWREGEPPAHHKVKLILEREYDEWPRNAARQSIELRDSKYAPEGW